ncbi:MAG: pseudaminic acid synthase [Cyclobacteriaceae bacterium]|nr:pseudaminic acid synthase [Cyclobacteriaceae bacterium]
MGREIKIGDFIISDSGPVFVIAELSANHARNLETAMESIKAISRTGANAVKVQTYKPESMTLDSDTEIFMTRKDSLWAGRKLFDLYKDGSLPYEWHAELKKFAEGLGLILFSTPFDIEAVDFLERLQVPAYKIASFEITDIPLISHIAGKGKPVLLSTGIAEPEDIQLAVDTCLQKGNDQIIILKCTSSYPTPDEDAHLNNISWLREKFKCLTGLSDHTLDIFAPIAAVSLGARVVEKHFILDRSKKSLDADFSLDPEGFSAMVTAIRSTEKLLGNYAYTVTEKMKKAKISCRSIFVTKDIRKGEHFSSDNIRVLRPGYGIHPRHYYDLMGKKAGKDLTFGTPLSWEDIIS